MLRKLMIVVMGLLLLATALASTKVQHKKDQQPSEALPKGNWGLKVGVARQATPVDVYSVTTDSQKRFTVASVKLKNHTNLNAVAVKLHWSLSKLEDTSRILLEGNTPQINVSIAAGETATLNYAVVSFAKIHKSLLTNGELNGDFRIEIRTAEVKYADSYGRRLADSEALDQIAVNFLAAFDEGEAGACPDQGCIYYSSQHAYSCYADVGAKCKPSEDKQSCNESRCGSLAD